ncbi:MAG TPA: DEAD/DEAH box helicase, partial [Rubricoccaceae bacterium]
QAVRTYGAKTGIRSATLYGGVGKGNQRTALKNGADILVATPGRLLDFLSEREVDLSHVDILVLDEADRMFDMGFLKDVRRIVAAVPEKRQTMLFSATMPPPIQELAKSVLYRPETVEIGNRSDPAATVTQRAVRVPEAEKQALLQHILTVEPVEKAIVFSRTKYRADKITKYLDRAGVAAVALHSNRSQGQRQRALQGFEAGDYRVLVATDLAGRGIDIDGVSHVVNFDTPGMPEDYIHRIGRTGRAEATGDAVTFVSADEASDLRAIEKHTGRPIELVTFDGFQPPAIGAAFEAADRRYAQGSTPTSKQGRGSGGGRGGARRESSGPKAPAGGGRDGRRR